MPLDDLVSVIETLQQRIRDHGDSLRQNEYRTRMALIDPLLTALGWDVADPGLVTPEYDLSGQRADYALLNTSANPAAFVEAKKLGESLVLHRMQMINYANMSGVPYAGLTDGNVWEIYTVFDQKPLPDRLILEANISYEPAHRCALKFLLLWRSNLAAGQPVAASEPLLIVQETITPTAEQTTSPGQFYKSTTIPKASEGWVSLAEIQTGGNEITGYPKGRTPAEIRLPDGSTRIIKEWWHILREVAEYFVIHDKLIASHCPLGDGKRAAFVRAEKQPDKVGNFGHLHELGNGLFLTKTNTGAGLINNARFLFGHFSDNPEAVQIRFQ